MSNVHGFFTGQFSATWETRGMILRQDGYGEEDKLYVCKRLGDGSFAWREI
ncbi:hypothetical protein [Paenibacillus sp. LC231]|uniref:hypothetical protein n=1 Tax=Paenibacillus sp. LC231 TaxID=1120679 RepID=UPI0013923CD3|nr:hypothetical protein [Paenibacillus sp. LC231]